MSDSRGLLISGEGLDYQLVPTPTRNSLVVLELEPLLQQVFCGSFPLPPSDNSLYGARGRRRFLSTKGGRFKDAVGYEMAHVKKSKDKYLWSFVADVCVGPGDYHRFDLSNLFKALIDAISDSIGVDDRYLCGYLPRKVYGHERMEPLVRVKVFQVSSTFK